LTPLIVDLETTTPGPKPDFRVDTVTQVGWLPLDGDVAQWAECFCPMPNPDPIVCHFGMYDVGIMHRTGQFPLAGYGYASRVFQSNWLHHVNIHDTLALAYSMGKQDLSLKGLGASELGVVTVPYAQRHLIGEEQYLAQDLFLTRDLLKKLLPLNKGTAYDIDRALIPALIDCSYRGYEVDQDKLAEITGMAESTCERMESAFQRMTEGEEVLISRRKRVRKSGTDYVEKHGAPSIGSPTQLGRLLDTPDTNKETLMALAAGGGDPGILSDLILHWREMSKALTTYFYPLQGMDKLTGLFNITPNEDMEGGTGTGRLSSERKNLQNQPPGVQRCLRAPPGFLIRRGDYPQIELRCAAEISGDPTMLAALSDPNRDLHQETADRLFNGDRQRGKTFNFKELFICGPAVRDAYPRFYEWAQEHWAEVQRTSYSVSPEPFLHRRFIPLLAGDHARRMAINHPVQSMAVYITKVAMTELFQQGSLLVNQVHDSIHDYVPEDGDKDLQKKEMASIMESVMREYLPRVGNASVDVKISKYWSDE
jgi:DNA polymerase I-like protein with 3'-5' exonuclease and polymerase domains